MGQIQCATREVCRGAIERQRQTREGQWLPRQMADGLVVPVKPRNGGRGKGPCFRTNARKRQEPQGLTMSLPTLLESVQKLQMALQAKAKAEPSYRFYSLWDKVYRPDVLWDAYRHCRTNGGAPGVDGVTFDQIEAQGVEVWLVKLQEELRPRVQTMPAGLSLPNAGVV